MTIDTARFKTSLEKEKKELEKELKEIARRNPKNPSEWEAVPENLEADRADEDEVAEKIESYEENVVATSQLEGRLEEVKKALARIAAKTYGTCEKCGKPIEKERLEANSAAATCIAHK